MIIIETLCITCMEYGCTLMFSAAALRNGLIALGHAYTRSGFLCKLKYLDYLWHPQLVRSPTNFGSEKWSAGTYFRVKSPLKS